MTWQIMHLTQRMFLKMRNEFGYRSTTANVKNSPDLADVNLVLIESQGEYVIAFNPEMDAGISATLNDDETEE